MRPLPHFLSQFFTILEIQYFPYGCLVLVSQPSALLNRGPKEIEGVFLSSLLQSLIPALDFSPTISRYLRRLSHLP